MLRVTVTSRAGGMTVLLEGRLAGPWVEEVARIWTHEVAAHRPQSIRVDIEGVSFVDAIGKALLATMHAEGATLVALSPMGRATVAEISGEGEQ
jgi:hypothetical protein